VRVVDSTLCQKTIRLNASAAFQLLVAARSEAVREAAAEALWPRELAEKSQLDCNDVPFESLPYSERVLALIVASVIERNPRQVKRLRVQPLYRFLVPGPAQCSSRVFCMRGYVEDQRVVGPAGNARSWQVSCAFVLPRDAEDTVLQKCNWGVVEAQHYRRTYKWVVGRGGVRLDIHRRVQSRALRAWSEPALLSHTGERLADDGPWVKKLFSQCDISLDSSLILRLCAGGLAGAVISFENSLPIVRGRKPRDATLSIEIGPGIESPAVGAYFKGDLSPRYELKGVLPSTHVSVGIVGGQTIKELHAIAQEVGVWHGDRMRGSFLYHPLREARPLEVT